ncbi:MAG TPA: hypothetical protein VFH27_05485, partial [Longimicrobiaceae bacterium]|nr:hypothetical protein [Longimicrobiaceae bacterium]
VHVVQQQGAPGAQAPAGAARPAMAAGPGAIQRKPTDASTQAVHDDLVEQYRAAMGYPPHGVDETGQQVGPTDAQIRFGGLLDAWLAANTPRTVPAPATAPTLVQPGQNNVTGICGSGAGQPACLAHHTYVQNLLPQAVANIRSVTSPYSAAVAAMYSAALPATRTAGAPTPGGASARAVGGPVTVTFGGMTHTFTSFTLELYQNAGGNIGGLNGRASGAVGIELNETSADAAYRNLAGLEATMVHEAMHVLTDIVESRNTAARAGGTPVTNRNLDREEYASVRTRLEPALVPFIHQMRQLPGFANTRNATPDASYAQVTAQVFLSETIARVEAGIYARQRAGQSFGAADLRTLPPVSHFAPYWAPEPAVLRDRDTYLQANAAQLDTTIEPLLLRAGEVYLALRP